MKKDLGVVPAVYPMPVLMVAAYDESGKVNVMNAAWGMICNMDKIALFIDEEHKTTQNILKTKAFTVSMATEDRIAECDYVGIVSANDVPDKFARSGFHAEKSVKVDAPLIRELPMALECELISYDESTCTLIGKIVNLCADESILTDGRIDPLKLRPITYDGANRDYYSFGSKVGKAFSDGRKIR